ncbi:MAG: metalloregulator ArsR/SmtB family transcription factor [Clostridia bacterium]|nr:metalloregulator ArsR/SmtB family transcription factor [Clostridia bacterium]
MSKLRVNLQTEPNYYCEAVMCLYESKWNQVEEVEKADKRYGQSKEKLAECIGRIKEYRDKVIGEIFQGRSFGYLMKFVDSDVSKFPYLLSLYFYCAKQFDSVTNESDIDKLIGGFVLERIGEVVELGGITELRSIDQVFNLINSPLFDDNEMMLILDTYGNRHKLYNCMKEYFEITIPILKNNFYIVERDFNKSIAVMSKIKEWDSFYSYYSTKFDDDVSLLNVNCGIMLFNKIRSFTNKDKGDYSMVGMKYEELKTWERDAIINNGVLLEYMKALADGTRLKILNVLRNKSMRVKDMASALNLTAPTISHHMYILLRLGIVEMRLGHSGDTVLNEYTISDERVEEICDLIRSITSNG